MRTRSYVSTAGKSITKITEHILHLTEMIKVKNKKGHNKNQTTNNGKKGKAKSHWGFCINVALDIAPFIYSHVTLL